MEHKHAEQQAEGKSASLISFGQSMVESFRMQTGFMDNMLSVFPPRPERLLCPGPKRCQAVRTESAVREEVNKVSCLQLGRWGERPRSQDFSFMKGVIDIKPHNCVISEAFGAGFRHLYF